MAAEFIHPPTHAEQAFGLLGPVYYVNHPLHRFEFAVKFHVNPASGLNLYEEDLTIIVKNVSIGGASIETDVANEYNRDRIVYNKIKYDDTTITFHDTGDGKSANLWKQYYEYYFSDGRGAITVNGAGGSLGAFGYDTTTIPGNNRRYVFDAIDIFQFQAGKANRTRLKNPKIIRYEPDKPDYADIEGLSEVSITFKPEYIQYERGRNIPSDILDQMALGGTPEQIAGPVNSFITSTEKEDANALAASLLEQQAKDTEYATNRRAIQNAAGSSLTESAVNSLITGSVKTKTSTSSLSSFGNLIKETNRKVPSTSNTNTRVTSKPLSASPVSTDNTAFGSVVNGDEQGGK